MSLPMCAICEDTPVTAINRRTCGHPRCVATYRATSRQPAKRKAVKWTKPDIYAPDADGRKRIADAWERSADKFGGAVSADRVLFVASRTKSRPVEVISVIRSELAT